MIFPIILEGNSLGKRHRQLNTLINDVIESKLPLEQIKDVAESCEVERLLKIDVASAQRNVEYILCNLQSDDMLYVSRALRSTWLIKDPQYAHIINPQYLHDQLFPLMINRAICKLKLTIRLQLTDESRCEEFFQYYYENNDMRQALIFLSLCSEKFILLNLENNKNEIPKHLVKRLCEKAPKAAYIFMKTLKDHNLSYCIGKLSFLAKAHTDIYLDLIEKCIDDYRFNWNLGRRSTFAIMQHHQDKVLSKPQRYIPQLHLPTVGKELGLAKIKEIIVFLSKNPDLDNRFFYDNIQPLLKGLSYNEKYELQRNIFEKRVEYKVHVNYLSLQCFSTCETSAPSISNMYKWYRYAPFPTTFHELKKLIRTEPQPDERLAMLKVLVESAKKNAKFLEQVLQYFHDRHINEPRNFREHFLKNLLKYTQAFRYYDRCWSILNELFHNLQIYEDSSSYMECCVETIMLYHMLRDSPIPNTILEKWWDTFSTLRPMAEKLTPDEREKVFRIIYSYTMGKIHGQSLNSTDDLRKMIVLTNKPLELLDEWTQPLSQHPDLLELLKKIIYKAQEFNLLDSINFYGRDTKWNRLLFSEALLMQQTQYVFMNTLKHDTDLLRKHEVQLQRALEIDDTNLDSFLTKLRIYFYNDLALECVERLKGRLGEVQGKRAARAICILMHRDSFSELVKKYVPQYYKIKWSEESAAQLNPRKCLAQQMFLVRPLVHVADILAFAKGDYLQFALPSLNSICFQLPAAKCEALLPKLLEGNVSLQKHAIRLAFEKISSPKLQDLFLKLWAQAHNASIRAVIFKHSFEMLCKAKKDEESQLAWEMLKLFINKLTTAEDRSIYATLRRAKRVPKRIRPEFCIISYRYLKTVPKEMNCSEHFNIILQTVYEIIDDVDYDFVYEIMNEFLESTDTERLIYEDSISIVFQKFLLACKSETDQFEKYNKIGKIYIKHTKEFWFMRQGTTYPVRKEFVVFVEEILGKLKDIILVRNCMYITPLPLFRTILKDIEDFLPFNDYVCIHVNLQLIIAILESFDCMKTEMAEVMPDEGKEFDMFLNRELFKCFGLRCGILLEDFLQKLCPSFVGIFSDITNNFLHDYFEYSYQSEVLQCKISMANALSTDSKNTPYNLLAVAILPKDTAPDHLMEDYISVFKRLQAIENVEIKLHFSNKFFWSELFDE